MIRTRHIVAVLLLAGIAAAQDGRRGFTRRGPMAPPLPRIGVRLDEGPLGEWRIASVVPLSPANHAGLKAGDLILMVRGKPVSFDEPVRFRELFATSPVLMTIERDGEEMFFIVPKRVFEM